MTMRRFSIILMIALLPLRSWAGDLMAVSMSVQALTPTSADIVVRQASGAMEDCAGHADSASEAAMAEAADDGHCKTCVTCQICHSVALVNIDVLASDPIHVNRLKSLSSSTFASATLADSVKPPIS
jgi:hypothetical protein